MQKELHKPKPPAKAEPPAKKPINRKYEKPTIDICEIGFAAFYTNLKYSENTLFLLSLYELDRELEDRKREQGLKAEPAIDPIDQQPHETELQWLRRILLEELKEFADVFLKWASNQLPPHRLYDYKIQLDNPEDVGKIGYSPLR